MKEVTDKREINTLRNELLENRSKEQKLNNDYSFRENGTIETCDDCGALINSHGHCPRCDYR